MVPQLICAALLSLLVCPFLGHATSPPVTSEVVHPGSFALVGPGTCLTVSAMDVWGKSRRDITHSECRELCRGGCIGYSYAPCERICTVHGDPIELSHLSEGDGWNLINGGGRIAIASQECGYSCYVRMLDCPAGVLNSNGVQVPHGPLVFRMRTSLLCPDPFVGELSVMCTAEGILQEGGRCRRQCEPSSFAYLTFRIDHGAIRHGETYSAPCPAGALGTVQLTCLDSEVSMVGGGCGNSCVGGAVRAGDAFLLHGALEYGASTVLDCPTDGYTGSVTVQCRDEGTVIIGGACHPHCQPGQANITIGGSDSEVNVSVMIPPLQHTERAVARCAPENIFVGQVEVVCFDGLPLAVQSASEGVLNVSSDVCNQHCLPGTVGNGLKETPHPMVHHGNQTVVPCRQGFTGSRQVYCDNGDLEVLSGECYMTCLPGTVTSNLVTLPHGSIEHNHSINITCPENYTGTLEVTCDDGAPLVSGFCGQQCTAGNMVSQDAIVPFTNIQHGSVVPFDCPAPYTGTLTLRCYDRVVLLESGVCSKQCDAGEFTWNDARITWDSFSHGVVRNVTCTPPFVGLTFSGFLTLECNDGIVNRLSGDCQADCAAFELLSGGIVLDYPRMDAFSQLEVECSADGLYGKVLLQCQAGFAQVISGSCGNPCEEGEFFADVTRDLPVTIGRVGHEKETWVTCPEPLSGQFRLLCQNSRYTVLEGECGERCRALFMEIPGSSFEAQQLDHLQVANYSCLEGYTGLVITECQFGELDINNTCSLDCANGTAVLAGGLEVDHGAMRAYEVTPLLPCPPGFDGGLALTCRDGVVSQAYGECLSNCGSGWYRQGELEVPHFQINHGESLDQVCPPPLFGSVLLSCQDGIVELMSGDCYDNCLPGNFTVRQGVVQEHAIIGHNSITDPFQCPSGFFGSFRLGCLDGVVNRSEGVCLADCQPASIAGTSHGLLAHNEVVSLTCDTLGQMTVQCFDGSVQTLSGYCFQRCEAGFILDPNGVEIEYGLIEHNRSLVGQCSGLSTGTVSVYCFDGVVEAVPLDGEGCLRGCPANANASAEDGTSIATPVLAHGSWDEIACPAGQLGILTARCSDGQLSVLGRCGSENCQAGSLEDDGATLVYPDMNDGSEVGPVACTSDDAAYIGEARIACANGVTTVGEVTIVSSSWPTSGPFVNDTQESPEEDRIILCGCCLPLDNPNQGGTVPSNDTGVLVWMAATIGTVCLGLAFGVGFYYFMHSHHALHHGSHHQSNKVVPEESIQPAKPV